MSLRLILTHRFSQWLRTGESGPRARQIRKEWVQRIRTLCLAAEIPFFFKQWGKRQFNADPDDPTMEKTHPMHAKGGCQLDGVVYRQLPTITEEQV